MSPVLKLDSQYKISGNYWENSLRPWSKRPPYHHELTLNFSVHLAFTISHLPNL